MDDDTSNNFEQFACRTWARRSLINAESAWANEYKRLLNESDADGGNRLDLLEAQRTLYGLHTALGRLVGDEKDPCRYCRTPIECAGAGAYGVPRCEAMQALALS